MEIITKSAKETFKFGQKLANTLKKDWLSFEKAKILALYGELGSGKTTFTQGFLKGLGIKKRIVSPTFILIREYKISSRKVYHVDLYRIKEIKEAENLGIEEILLDSQNIVIIEWAEKIKEILPKKRIEIFFEYIDETTRKINYITLK